MYEHRQQPCKKVPVYAVLVIGLLILALTGCASWQLPAEFDDSALRARADSQQLRGVKLSAAVLSSEDSQQMFGVRVNDKEVQPVWIEVENNTDRALWLLRSGTDPDLFSPLEVAWSFHTAFAGESNSRLDEHFGSLGFQNPISPGSKQSGILFTNPHLGTRLLSVDILGNGEIFPFTLYPPVPDDQTKESTTVLANVEKVIAEIRHDIQDVDHFRATLEQMPCCATSEDGGETGDPLNVVLIGSLDDMASALVRRDFRMDIRDIDKVQSLFGRPPDVVVRKKGQAGAPANWLRIWVAPFKFQGKTVFVVQAGRRQGWRMQEIEDDNMLLNPRVDEVRNLFIQDLLYSSALHKLAFVCGVGATEAGASRKSLGGASYQTDGLRAVLFLVTRPLSLSELEILEWHPYLRYAETEAASELEDAEK
jgi:hypothetical protein